MSKYCQFFSDAVRRSQRGPVGHIALNVDFADCGELERIKLREVNAKNDFFPSVSRRGKPGFLILQVAFGNFPERVFARRLIAEHASLFDAQEFSRANLFRLRNVLCVRLAEPSAALRVSPAYPPARTVFALINAVSLLRRLFRHQFCSTADNSAPSYIQPPALRPQS
jgi:hypothetical protein